MSDIEDISNDYCTPHVGLFESRLRERKEAVLNQDKFKEFLAAELQRQEAEEPESEEEKPVKVTRVKKQIKRKRIMKKRSTRNSNKTKYYESSGSETSSDDHNAEERSPFVIKSSDDELVDGDVNKTFELHENSSTPNSPKFHLSKKTKKRLRKQHEKRQKEMAAFDLSNLSYNDSPVLVCDDSNDPEPYEEINLKIWNKGKILNKVIKKSSSFSEVFQYISEQNDVPISDVFIYFNDEAVGLEDTPEKLGISLADILNSVVMSPESSTVKNRNCIEIKIQSKDSKVKTVMSVYKLDPLQKVMQKYASDKGLELQNLVFEFDGDKIFPNQTPMELDIDDGCVIDVKIIK